MSESRAGQPADKSEGLDDAGPVSNLDSPRHQDARPGRKPTVEEAEAILTLVKGGWLTLTLDLSDDIH